MNTTYTQQLFPTQKKGFPTAASVFDASSQSESLQRKADMANNAAQRAEPPRPNNTGMPDNLKAGVESLSGFSMDDVRVHYNSGKPATVQALAYTQGTDIHVAPGQEKHLPHEAWHVAQQMAGRVSPTTNINGMPVNDNAGLEHEADIMGEKAVNQKKKNKYVTTKKTNTCMQMFFDSTIYNDGNKILDDFTQLSSFLKETEKNTLFQKASSLWYNLHCEISQATADEQGYAAELKQKIIQPLKEEAIPLIKSFYEALEKTDNEAFTEQIWDVLNHEENSGILIDPDKPQWTKRFLTKVLDPSDYSFIPGSIPDKELNSNSFIGPFKEALKILKDERKKYEKEKGYKEEEEEEKEKENFHYVCDMAIEMCNKVSATKKSKIMNSYFKNKQEVAKGNFGTIKTKITDIKDKNLFHNSYTCERNVYAYTTPSKKVGKNKEKIRLGTLYRKAHNSESPSQAGIIIHEASHLCIKTEDHAYERENCQKLTEDKAIKNADSYRLSAEEVWFNKESPTEEIDSKVVKTKEI